MMSYETLVTDADRERVLERIDRARRSWSTYSPLLDCFRTGLGSVRTVRPAEVPGDVITMNSRFDVVDRRTGERTSYTLVYPEDEALEKGKLCVLSPMGMALLGARVGDVVYWHGVNGPGSAHVARMLYQPEAAGQHDL